ncbi:MAG TPA: hypothetical protein DCZ63_09070 [Geobacter sp.]|nr:hypothetical protein [Geobacter sp.]
MPKIMEAAGKLNWTFFCPGCQHHHGISTIPPGPVWIFNGDVNSPTFSPSLMVKRGPKCDPVTHLAPKGAPGQVCHSFIRGGKIQFLNDCTHELAGQTVDMVDED